MSIPVSQLQPKLMILSKTTPLGNVQSTKDNALILKYTRTLTRGARIFFQSVRGHRGRQNSRHIADYSTTIDAGTTGGHHLGGPGPPGPAPGPPREPCSARGAHPSTGPFHTANTGTLANAPHAALLPPPPPQRPPHAPCPRSRLTRSWPRPQRPLWSTCSGLRPRKHAQAVSEHGGKGGLGVSLRL